MPPASPSRGIPRSSCRRDLADQRQRPVLERLGPDQGPVEPGLPAAGVADVVEVFARGLHQPVSGARDLLGGLRLEDQPQRVCGLRSTLRATRSVTRPCGGTGMNSVMNSSRCRGVTGIASSSWASS